MRAELDSVSIVKKGPRQVVIRGRFSVHRVCLATAA